MNYIPEVAPSATWREGFVWDAMHRIGAPTGEIRVEKPLDVTSGTGTGYAANVAAALRYMVVDQSRPAADYQVLALRTAAGLQPDHKAFYQSHFRRATGSAVDRGLLIVYGNASTSATRETRQSQRSRKNTAAIELLRSWLREDLENPGREPLYEVAASINASREGYRRVFP